METRRELLSDTKGELIGKLNERYGIGKSATYKRLEFLEISVSQERGQSFLLSAELKLLDELNDWIGQGKAMHHFAKPGKLAVSGTGSIEEAPESIEYTTAEDGNQINQLVRTAQEKAAGLLMAENILAARFKDNPELLPEDLRSQVRATEEAVAPKSIDPKEYAGKLIARYRTATAAA